MDEHRHDDDAQPNLRNGRPHVYEVATRQSHLRHYHWPLGADASELVYDGRGDRPEQKP